MLSKVKSFIVSKRYWTSTTKHPSSFNTLNAFLVIDSKSSAWANTLDAVIKSAFCSIKFVALSSKYPQ